MKKALATQNRNLPSYNQKAEVPMIYEVSIIGWDDKNPLWVDEPEREKILSALSQDSWVNIGNNTINPKNIRFIKGVHPDKREEQCRYEHRDGKVYKICE